MTLILKDVHLEVLAVPDEAAPGFEDSLMLRILLREQQLKPDRRHFLSARQILNGQTDFGLQIYLTAHDHANIPLPLY